MKKIKCPKIDLPLGDTFFLKLAKNFFTIKIAEK